MGRLHGYPWAHSALWALQAEMCPGREWASFSSTMALSAIAGSCHQRDNGACCGPTTTHCLASSRARKQAHARNQKVIGKSNSFPYTPLLGWLGRRVGEDDQVSLIYRGKGLAKCRLGNCKQGSDWGHVWEEALGTADDSDRKGEEGEGEGSRSKPLTPGDREHWGRGRSELPACCPCLCCSCLLSVRGTQHSYLEP